MNIIQLKVQSHSEKVGGETITASPHEKALSALMRMKKNRIHHLPVVSENQLVGMVSDRDIIASALSVGVGDELSWLSVDQAMRRDIKPISENSEVGEVLKIMLDGGFSALPIIDDGVLQGVVTESDILKVTAKLLEKSEKGLPPGAKYLAHPLAQKLLSLLSDLGI